MTRKLRLGIIGTGVAARILYLPAFKKLRHRIELVACANRRRTKAEAYAHLAKIPTVVDTAEELIALPQVDAVLISLPIHLQPRYVLEALARKKPVLSEKPVAPSFADGQKLLKAAARFKTPWLVGENYAFMSHVRQLHQWLEQGRLGEVRLVEVVQIDRMDRTNPFFNTAWRARPKHVGGFVVDAGVHLADVVRRCVGLPVEVKSMTARLDPALPPPDTAVAALEFESGTLGTWTSCFTARYDGPMVRLYGSRANAELGSTTATLIDNKGRKTIYRTRTDSFFEQFSHFADVVLEQKPLAFTPAEALDDLAFIEAIARGR